MSKKALILTDGSESIQSIALLISDALSDCKVNICPIEAFVGTELLGSDIFFLGCENANPLSFAFLEEMLSHINLAPRKCGVFSRKEKSLNYLCGILKDCDVTLGSPAHIVSENIPIPHIKKWVDSIVNSK